MGVRCAGNVSAGMGQHCIRNKFFPATLEFSHKRLNFKNLSLNQQHNPEGRKERDFHLKFYLYAKTGTGRTFFMRIAYACITRRNLFSTAEAI